MAPQDLVGREIVVPGSTSNLGAGFDALGLALRCYLRVRIVAVRDDARGVLTWSFGGRALDGDNYVERAFRHSSRPAGALPSASLEVTSEIPVKAGLGSSAAAIVAGFRLHELLVAAADTQDLLDEAAALEGHPDNTSASLLGGFVASCRTPSGRVAAVAVPWPGDLRLVVATPAVALDTRVARAVLPASVPFADAVGNVQRTALLVQSLAAGDRRWLRESFRDRLHQPYRSALVPGLDEALGFEHDSLLGVFLSGAGPSIAAVVRDDGGDVSRMFAALYRGLGLGADIRTYEAHQPGGPG